MRLKKKKINKVDTSKDLAMVHTRLDRVELRLDNLEAQERVYRSRREGK
jgi:hypothetical protein